MGTENTNDSEFNSELDYEYPDYIPLKVKLCVVCASILQTEVRNEPGRICSPIGDVRDRTHVSPFQLFREQLPISSDKFLEGLSVFCETLNIDKCYIDYEKWAVDGGDENFARYVCCRSCYSRFAQLVTLYELIVATQESLRKDVRAIQLCVVQSQANAVEFSHNTCHRFREDVIQNFETTSHDVEAPEFLLTSDVEDEVGNIDLDVEFDGDYYADSTFFENVPRNQEPVSKKRGRRRKPKASMASISSVIDEVVGQHGLPPKDPVEVSSTVEGERDRGTSPKPPVIVSISSSRRKPKASMASISSVIDEVVGQHGLPPKDPVEVSSTVEGERDHGTSPKPPVIVSISSSADQGQNRFLLKSALPSDSETFQVKRNRGRPRKNGLCNSPTTQGNHEPVSGCSRSLNNESIVKKKRGRPRKSEPSSPRSQTTLVEIENLTPVQVSSCLPDDEIRSTRRREKSQLNKSVNFLSNATHDINYQEVPTLSPNNDSIVERKGERPQKEHLILDSDTPRTVAAKRERGRPRKDESSGSPQAKPEENLLTYLRLEAKVSSCLPISEENTKRKRGRPRKSESIGPRSHTTPAENLTPVLVSSCLPDDEIRRITRTRVQPPLNESVDSLSNVAQEFIHEEGSVLSPNNHSIIKRKRGRPRKESLILDSDTPITVAAKRGRGRPRKDDSARLNSDLNAEFGKIPGSS